ncbi:coatomer subunit beta'-2-like protein [Chytriomyces sp. MP71]|nr:coatomer subunit beta'-2-like protein [Chytriomyces sp. MP71]
MVSIIDNKFATKSARVKAIAFHSSEPLYATALHNGTVEIWNTKTETIVKTLAVSKLPLRAIKFVPQTAWLVVGGDDLKIHVLDVETGDQITEYTAHQDYIRSFSLHPTKPLLLSASDDKTVKLWDWNDGWKNVQTFTGHSHYIMQAAFHPKDPAVFATASLDSTVRLWSLASGACTAELRGHTRGVNCVEFCEGGARLLSGSDDATIRVWDVASGVCVQTVTGAHEGNVCSVKSLEGLGLVVSGGEDERVVVFDGESLAVKQTLDLGLKRVWYADVAESGKEVGFGCDEGAVIVGFSKAVKGKGSLTANL